MTPSHLSASLDALWIPLLIAIGILLFSVWRFGASASRIRRIRRAMDDLRARLVAQPSAEAPQILRACLRETQDPQLRFLLRETEAGMIALPATDGAVRHASLRSHAEQWTLRDVVGGRVNLALFETMPNLLIGFGLMCTFIFLAIALQQAGVALQALDATSRQQDQALQGLIATAGGSSSHPLRVYSLRWYGTGAPKSLSRACKRAWMSGATICARSCPTTRPS